ncbi:glycosyltransferase family 2 protein [Saccharopolyspora sp. HNM0986]|uniref:glycosyltransferase family 2 protein n=1 Tax=Saccharopolyspora galaxeae TaxID=2781241 RepID=UPI0019099EF8|nr:glycosyltransferase family 2 protein [Saccharopolyspora sp. HNM0986]MBK0870761.1 glycosyltransferase family 2 protein [Saccharopolyspora sp. HNM0986]
MAARIAVICPAFNRSAAILPTVESVLAQTVQDWELLVVSDGSTDDTDEVVRAVRDPRVRLLRVANHGCPGGPRNAGLAATSAPYVAYLDHDDVWLPNHLEVLLGMLQAGAPLAGTGCVRVGPSGRVRHRSGVLDSVWHPELQVLNAMYEPSRVGHVRPLVAEAGGWSTAAAGFEDWDLWTRLAERGVDFAVAADRTSVLTLEDGSRRHLFSPRHSIGLAKTGAERDADRVRDLLAGEHGRARAEAAYLADTEAWYVDLWDSARCVRPPEVRRVDVLEAVRAKLASGEAGSFLHGLVTVPHAGGFVLALPTAVLNPQHRGRIRELLARRCPAQLRLLRELRAQASTGAL